ncbi:uncharacterized protein UTRI_02959 [Ustilago trichophora]|uniref:Uncharacterized protein n=1 Tax=Ustilago trichophora TaxID=86804 RepID=A0A5C3EPN0_9BASI|nr:uncharacterized protein UTRI_02959 [Ustilago trichophora]
MVIAMPSSTVDDPLNTVAVVPFDIAPATSSRGASTSSSATAAASARSLAAAASNLISAIAQGSNASNFGQEDRVDPRSGDESDDGSSSFTYTAPASTSPDIHHAGWYASTPYHISNRYYDADITLKATKAALYNVTFTDGALSHPFPAYLVVVDRSRSLEHHRLLAASLEARVASGFEADISIIAGVSLFSSAHSQLVMNLDDEPRNSSSSAARQQEETRAKTSDLVALYAGVGWEFIAIDEIDADVSDGGLRAGSEDGDGHSDGEADDEADGIERIREALMNHMWNGLVRKGQTGGVASRSLAGREGLVDAVSSSLHRSFSDSQDAVDDANDFDVEDDLDGATSESNIKVEESSRSASKQHFPSLSNNNQLGGNLPSLDLDDHAEASDLDEQLAKLFLSTSRGNDLAELEAFLESQDPSWPAPLPTAASFPEFSDKEAFDDDFDDFLPFQSAPSTTNPTSSSSSSTTRSASNSTNIGSLAEEVDDLPSISEISNMQNRLFGSNAAARLEAGPLGMGASQANEANQDLASQLQQLQWHAERVRGIEDPDQRRKEAALVALAFSMQWDGQGEGQAGAMNF